MTPTEKIDQIIKERNISRRKLAIKAKIPPSTLQSAMERNKNLSLEMLQEIANALEVPITELLETDQKVTSMLSELKQGLDVINNLYGLDDDQGRELRKRVVNFYEDTIFKIEHGILERSVNEGLDVNPRELIMSDLNRLNDIGQQIAVERVRELTTVGRFCKDEE